jgi:hypothetical protein
MSASGVADRRGAPGRDGPARTAAEPADPPPASATPVAGGTSATAPWPPRRIHILGAPGSGKTTLARRLAAVTGLPVHHLDEVARVGGGTGPIRTEAERTPLVAAIAIADAWIVEGVHLGWTGPLLERAELIVWLDGVTPAGAAARITRRFAAGAWAELRRRSWRERALAVPGYARHARDLAGALRDARRYRATHAAPSAPRSTLGSRDETAVALAPHAGRVRRCGSAVEVESLLALLTPATPPAR